MCVYPSVLTLRGGHLCELCNPVTGAGCKGQLGNLLPASCCLVTILQHAAVMLPKQQLVDQLLKFVPCTVAHL